MKQDHRQGRRLIKLLKIRGMTSLELQMTGISTCWHKRVAETLEPGERLVSHKNARGLNVYRVTKEYKSKTVWVK